MATYEEHFDITEKQIQQYIDYTMKRGDTHIRGEIKWLIENANPEAKSTIKDLADTKF